MTFVDRERCDAKCHTLLDDVLPVFIQGRGISLRLGVVDCHDDRAVCADYNVTTFPTLVLLVRCFSLPVTISVRLVLTRSL